jgi:SecY interacting protein Syd
MNNSSLALEALLTRYSNLFQDTPEGLPFVEFEQDWTSACVVKPGNIEGSYFWKPVKREKVLSFHDLETALEVSFHPDIWHFYGSFWSNGICVERHDINFNLIQIWNEEDEQLLKENLLGHAFAKIKAKLPLSFFIGCTNGDEIICLEQESGHIVLEKPGYKGHKILATDLESFLISLQPTTDNYSN